MSVKKNFVKSAVITALMMVATQSAIASKMTDRPTTTVSGSLTLTESCDIAASLKNGNFNLLKDNATGNAQVIDVLTVTPTCDGHVYAQFLTRDANGYGVASSNTGEKISVALDVNTTGWQWDFAEQVAYNSATANTPVTTNILLSKVGDYVSTPNKAAGQYDYTIEVGYWQN